MLTPLLNKFRFINIINNSSTQISRSFKSDLKIKWVRPEKIPCISPIKSGDCSGVPKYEPTTIVPAYRDSKELETANELVKSLFTLEHSPRNVTSKLIKDEFADKVKRHFLDLGSMETKIAVMTATIRRHQEAMQIHPRNKRLKVQLKELIDKRKKFLKYVRRWDYRRFEWLLEELDLIYKPPPTEFHWITRKESLRKLTNIHCENIRNERLENYRKYLESQQIDFLERKLKNLEFIRSEQQACQVPVTVSQDTVNEVRKKLEKLRLEKQSDTVQKK